MAVNQHDTPAGVVKERDWRVTRLGDELDKLLKLITWARECIENELTEGMGTKKMGLTDKDIRKIKDLSATMNSAVEAKIRFDKAQKQLAESMTPEEEFAAVAAYIKTLDRGQKQCLLNQVRYPGAPRNGSDTSLLDEADADSSP